jgi:hypothetical protein
MKVYRIPEETVEALDESLATLERLAREFAPKPEVVIADDEPERYCAECGDPIYSEAKRPNVCRHCWELSHQ